MVKQLTDIVERLRDKSQALLCPELDHIADEIIRLRAALASKSAPVIDASAGCVEPVGHVHREGKRADGKPWMAAYFAQDGTNDLPDGMPLYAAPQQRQPLTDEQYQAISDETGCIITGRLKDAIARAVEAAHGIKETK
jgi:hypothetical protein